jgi:hypothetical protein
MDITIKYYDKTFKCKATLEMQDCKNPFNDDFAAILKELGDTKSVQIDCTP